MESCATCKLYWVDQGEVELQLGTDGKPVPRGKGLAPEWTEDLCKICIKTERRVEDWTPLNKKTWDHFCIMRDLGPSDDERKDSRVRRNAALLGSEIRQIERLLLTRMMNDNLVAMLGGTTGG